MSELEQAIGRVICVSGSQIITMLNDDLRTRDSELNSSVQKGRLVKMHTADTSVYGVINGLSVPVPSQDAAESEVRIIELELLGEIESGAVNGKAGFQRGVSVFPALGDKVYSTTQEDLEQVYTRLDPSAVRIGTIHQDKTLPASIVPNDLLGKHFAVLGTTGSGKSCAVTLILHAIIERHANAHVVLLDIHNEYATAFGEKAEILDPNSLELPYWLLNFDEIEEIVLGRDTGGEAREAASNILRDMIVAAKKRYKSGGNESMAISPDTPVPYSISELTQLIDESAGKLDKAEKAAPYRKLKSRIQALRDDSRFGFIFGGIAVRDNMAKILSRIFRVPVDGKPITIFDLSSVPSEILNVVVSVVGRLTFDFALWSDRAVPILLVCEEAHRYAPQNASAGFEPTKRALAKIAKEGRKYGVSLCVVSQRPSELATDVLSQCNTIFALRMGNQKDRDFVRSVMSDAALSLLDFLPSLRNGEAIAVGEGITVPVRLSFDKLPADKLPRSGTAAFSTAWQEEIESVDFVAAVVERWRRQQH
jgi:DNA helicase HerA-like ATPase